MNFVENKCNQALCNRENKENYKQRLNHCLGILDILKNKMCKCD